MKIRGLLLALAVLVLAAACGGGKSKSPPAAGNATSPSSPSASPETTPLAGGQLAVSHGSRDVTTLSEANLELGDFYFSPTELSGKPGQTLTLHLSNSGQAVHNFSLQAQGIDQDVQAGQKDVTVKVTFPGSGGVVFICKYHATQNMRGELRAS